MFEVGVEGQTIWKMPVKVSASVKELICQGREIREWVEVYRDQIRQMLKIADQAFLEPYNDYDAFFEYKTKLGF